MEKDKLNTLFETLENSLDVHQAPVGHQKRFLDKLNAQGEVSKVTMNWWKPLSVAASIAILCIVGSFLFNDNTTELDLASVSPEMEETQTFFTTTINKELETLKSFNNTETKALVDDALEQLEILENEYNKLKIDLTKSGNDKRVIYAMISNFQNRIDLLEQVIATIEEIKNLKNNTHETTI